MFEAIETA